MSETRFIVHTAKTAPAPARATLEQIEKKYGFVPNLYGVFAEAPAALDTYLAISERFGQTSLSSAARDIVLLTASRENGCTYCVAVHSAVALRQGVPQAIVDAVRDERPLADARLEAVRTLTRTIVRKRGFLDEADLGAFLEAGWERAQVLEVLVGVTLKTLSNYTNHLAHTPLDAAFASQAWTPSDRRGD